MVRSTWPSSNSSQAVLAITAWSATRRVRAFDARYDVPLHLLTDPVYWTEQWTGIVPVHVHYHGMFSAPNRTGALATLARVGVPADRLDLIAARSRCEPGSRYRDAARSPWLFRARRRRLCNRLGVRCERPAGTGHDPGKRQGGGDGRGEENLALDRREARFRAAASSRCGCASNPATGSKSSME